MASNEIELTFIRCPSCKSLMPSTAHKCGMCGLSMDEEETVPSEKKLRLRQRTNSDLNDIVSTAEIENKKHAEPASKSDLFKEGRPLAPSFQETPSSSESYDDSDEDNNVQFDSDDDLDDSSDEELGEQELASEGEPIRKRKRRRKRKKKPPMFDSASEDTGERVEKSEEVVNSNWGSNLKPETAKEDSRKDSPADSRNLYRDFNFSEGEKPQGKVPPYRERETPIENKIDENTSRVSESKIVEEKEIVQNTKVNVGIKMNEGKKLLGWFVNYSTDSNGKYFEIRTGKKFIGRQELRPHDLLIPDSAISTPHCLLNAEGDKLGLQDLMSDQGTFVKHAGESDYKKIESTVQLKHGDVLRLGTFELIVCLIPTN